MDFTKNRCYWWLEKHIWNYSIRAVNNLKLDGTYCTTPLEGVTQTKEEKTLVFAFWVFCFIILLIKLSMTELATLCSIQNLLFEKWANWLWCLHVFLSVGKATVWHIRKQHRRSSINPIHLAYGSHTPSPPTYLRALAMHTWWKNCQTQ